MCEGMKAGFVEDLSYRGVDVQNRTEESKWTVRSMGGDIDMMEKRYDEDYGDEDGDVLIVILLECFFVAIAWYGNCRMAFESVFLITATS